MDGHKAVSSQDTVSLVDNMADNQEMDLDATFVVGGKRAGGPEPEPQAKKANLNALASAYKAKVEQTQAKLVLKKGGGPLNPQPSLEGYVETEYINEVVKVDMAPKVTSSYAAAPLVTLRELLPVGVIDDEPQDLEGANLDQVFRAETMEFIVMIKPLPKDGIPPAVEWEFPKGGLFETSMNEAFADFIDKDITRMDIIKWSSISTQTGIGAFSAITTRLNLVQAF